jgi:hypothetical protein
VVVAQDDGGRVESQSLTHHLAGVHTGLRQSTGKKLIEFNHAVLRVEHREADLPFGLCRAFGDPDQHPDLPVVTEYTGIQQAFDLHRGLARTQIFGAQDRVMCVAHGQWFFCNSKVDYIPRRIVYNTTKMV